LEDASKNPDSHKFMQDVIDDEPENRTLQTTRLMTNSRANGNRTNVSGLQRKTRPYLAAPFSTIVILKLGPVHSHCVKGYTHQHLKSITITPFLNTVSSPFPSSILSPTNSLIPCLPHTSPSGPRLRYLRLISRLASKAAATANAFIALAQR
jgi:hypothetical protein